MWEMLAAILHCTQIPSCSSTLEHSDLHSLSYLFWTLSFAALHHRLVLFSVNTHFLTPSHVAVPQLELQLIYLPCDECVTLATLKRGTHSDACSHTLRECPRSLCHLVSAGSDKCFLVQVSFFINIPHKPDLQYP